MSPPKLAPIPKAVIDTGCLFNMLALNFVRREKIVDPRRNAMLNSACNSLFDNQPAFADKYYDYLRRYKLLLTTQHVMAELSALVSRWITNSEERELFWDHSVELMINRKMTERPLSLLHDIQSSRFRQQLHNFGIPDIGLLELAFRERAELLTEDGKLASKNRHQSVTFTIVSEQFGNY